MAKHNQQPDNSPYKIEEYVTIVSSLLFRINGGIIQDEKRQKEWVP